MEPQKLIDVEASSEAIEAHLVDVEAHNAALEARPLDVEARNEGNSAAQPLISQPTLPTFPLFIP